MKVKNIFLDLDETLISSIEVDEYHQNKEMLDKKKAPFTIFEGYYYIYERPGVQEFLDYVFENYNVSVFTAAHKDYALHIIKHVILPENKPERKLDYIFFTYHCKLSTRKYKNHKFMSMIWDDFGISGYDETNTVIIDDKEELLDNQPNNVINCKVYDIMDSDSDQDKDFDRLIMEIEKKSGVNIESAPVFKYKKEEEKEEGPQTPPHEEEKEEESEKEEKEEKEEGHQTPPYEEEEKEEDLKSQLKDD